MMAEEIDPLQQTTPENIPVTIRGFEDRQAAKQFGHLIAHAIRSISRYIDLSRLDGVTVAYDYDAALAELDRGYETTRRLTRTAGTRTVGVAMAPAVLRDGVVKGHLVFYAPAVLPIEDSAHAQYSQAIYVIAHECAHVEDLKWRDERFPGTILQRQIYDFEEGFFAPITDALWDEYAACRMSGVFGDQQAGAYEECLVNALGAARNEANAAIRAYRLHGDVDRVLEGAGRPLCEPLRYGAYLIGHLDGRGEDWDAVPRARDRVSESEYASHFERLAEVLRELWSTCDRWESTEVFDPLKEIARDVLAAGGMAFMRQPDGTIFVDIPFTSDTMPRQ